MKDRTFQQKKTYDDGKIIIKIPFVKGIRKLRLQKHYKKMVASLRTLTKSSFLDDLRMVIAHPVVQNSFLETYRLNFVPKVYSAKSRVGSESGGCTEGSGGPGQQQ